MVYCKKCARLLDEDVRVCPYCQNEDVDFTEADDAAGRLQQIDEQIARNQSAPVSKSAEYVEPSRITVEPSAQGGQGGAYYGAVPPDDEKPGTGLYVGLILLSVFLTLPGMITGIVYMTNKKAAYRKMGLVVLLVGIACSVIWCISCCAFFYAIGASLGDIVY